MFDEGNGDLTDGAWARISPNDPKTVELAFKLEMIGNPKFYAMGACGLAPAWTRRCSTITIR